MAGRLALALEHRRRAARQARGLIPPPPNAFGAFGAGTFLAAPARVLRPDRIFIGRDVFIHPHSRLSVTEVVAGHEPSLVIGDRVHIGRFCTIACVGSIEIGSDVLTADRIFIGDSHHAYEDPDQPISEQGMSVPAPVVIGPGSFLGIGAAVLEGVTVGEHAYVGAGAVVTADVAPFTLVVGNPARAVRAYDAEARAWLPV